MSCIIYVEYDKMRSYMMIICINSNEEITKLKLLTVSPHGLALEVRRLAS